MNFGQGEVSVVPQGPLIFLYRGVYCIEIYSIRPKMIVLIPGYFCRKLIVLLLISFCLKMNVQFLCDLQNDIKKIFDTGLDVRGSNSNILEMQSHHEEDFGHHNLWGCFRVVANFDFDCHTYNYSLNGGHALISPKLENKKIILRRKEHLITPTQEISPNIKQSKEAICVYSRSYTCHPCVMHQRLCLE